MEFSLKAKDSAFPCEVTIDEDNGRYMIRKADTSGEVFNTPEELVQWIIDNWNNDDFQDQEQFDWMMKEIQVYISISQ
ncbi:hypothetical protein [Thermaerobacillus caldiproteolyticus]|uniref:hypothetical protein n=1 Tax=Thermaerobacillus caldiproteolyticus TaxID=247480 RepID=UPI00188B707B|nr:hypothetical protein [Anoxybacillus caldiproteolyticus]QPA32305.1 hypothetical protein ISX45_04845 [Anoxybacillus caldiproteolyticus]